MKDKEYVHRIQELRRSGAAKAQVHGKRRLRTRATAKRAAIKEHS